MENKYREHILYYKKKIEDNRSNDPMVIDSLVKLERMNVSPQVLTETGICDYILKLSRRYVGEVSKRATSLHRKWKHLITTPNNDTKRRLPSDGRPNQPEDRSRHTSGVNSSSSQSNTESSASHASVNHSSSQALSEIVNRNRHSSVSFFKKDPLNLDGSCKEEQEDLSLDECNINLKIDNEPVVQNGGETTHQGYGKVYDPYHIDMSEGQFIAVKTKAPPFSVGKAVFQHIEYEVLMNVAMKKESRKKFSMDSHSQPSEPVANGWADSASHTDNVASNRRDRKRTSSSAPCANDSDAKKGKKSVPEPHPDKAKLPKPSSNVPKPTSNNTDPSTTNCDKKMKKNDAPDETGKYTSSKKERTSIYSGKKSIKEVPRLKDLSTRMIQKNYECLKYLRSRISYEILKPILEPLPPMKLLKIEDSNSNLVHCTDELWKIHSQRDFRSHVPAPHESWRTFYLRCLKEKNNKLKNLTASITASTSNAKADRQAKLTVVDSPVNPSSKRQRHNEVLVSKSSTPVVAVKSLPPMANAKTPVVSLKAATPVVNSKATFNSSSKSVSVAVARMPVKEVKPVNKAAKKAAPLMSKVKKTFEHMKYKRS